MKQPEWVMSPIERAQLATWLGKYKAEEIMVDTALEQLRGFGVLYDWGRSRLSFGNRSVEINRHSREYFQRILGSSESGGRGYLTPGPWMGIWMLDIAVALLNLAGAEQDPTGALPTKRMRYKVVVDLLRGEGDFVDANDIGGEVRE